MITTYQIGIVVQKILPNIYVINIGFSRLRFFKSDEELEIGELIIYDTELSYEMRFKISINPELSKFYKMEENEVRLVDKLSSFQLIDDKTGFSASSSFSADDTMPDKMILRLRRQIVNENQERYCSNIWIKDKKYTLNLGLNFASKYLLKRRCFNHEQMVCKRPDKSDLVRIYFNIKKKIDELDIPEIINSMSVKVSNVCFTHRGSDNYLSESTYMRSDYLYLDEYLEKLFPAINITLYHYDERTGEEWVCEQYPDRAKWKEEANRLEEDFKQKSFSAYIKDYSKENHILTLVFHELDSCYKSYEDDVSEIVFANELVNICWNKKDISLTLNSMIMHPDSYASIIREHNNKIKETNMVLFE